MASGERTILGAARATASALALAREWRKLARAATFVAVLTSPATFAVFYVGHDWPVGWALLATFAFVIAFRGVIDVLAHKLIPRASLYGAGRELLARGHRRPAARLVLAHTLPASLFVAARCSSAFVLTLILASPDVYPAASIGDCGRPARCRYILILGIQIPLLFLANFLIFFGPLLFFGAQADEGLRAGRRRLGRQARRRPRPGRAQGGGHARHLAVAVGRGVPQGGRQARARPAVHRRAGHRQDDALQGDRDVVQLADRDDAGLGLRADVHRHGRRSSSCS